MRALILLALLGFAAAVPKNPQRIVGGTPTTVEEYPYMSNMQYGWWGGMLWFQACGGSLINSQSVLSAAHCYVGDSHSEWRVLLGTSLAQSGGTVHYASQLILHADYSDWTLDNDIAIIRLATPAVYSNSVAPVSIAGANYNLADGTQVTTIGWGALFSGGHSPEQLQHVDIYTINMDFCKERYAYLKSQSGFQSWPDVTDNMLCAGIQDVGGKDACQGDSGGPLVHKGTTDVLIGAVSWGYGCAHRDYPGVNTRVSRYTDWIVDRA
ncbi:trypsin, alkaline C-like [Cydia strobilella]|uniref:trypsin, alkaline C-like n=1 Tax=Cydia strobilella TaxID=1100964 RepID=UPI003007C8B7